MVLNLARYVLQALSTDTAFRRRWNRSAYACHHAEIEISEGPGAAAARWSCAMKYSS
jgi:hypothetical protein